MRSDIDDVARLRRTNASQEEHSRPPDGHGLVPAIERLADLDVHIMGQLRRHCVPDEFPHSSHGNGRVELVVHRKRLEGSELLEVEAAFVETVVHVEPGLDASRDECTLKGLVWVVLGRRT